MIVLGGNANNEHDPGWHSTRYWLLELVLRTRYQSVVVLGGKSSDEHDSWQSGVRY